MVFGAAQASNRRARLRSDHRPGGRAPRHRRASNRTRSAPSAEPGGKAWAAVVSATAAGCVSASRSPSDSRRACSRRPGRCGRRRGPDARQPPLDGRRSLAGRHRSCNRRPRRPALHRHKLTGGERDPQRRNRGEMQNFHIFDLLRIPAPISARRSGRAAETPPMTVRKKFAPARITDVTALRLLLFGIVAERPLHHARMIPSPVGRGRKGAVRYPPPAARGRGTMRIGRQGRPSFEGL